LSDSSFYKKPKKKKRKKREENIRNSISKVHVLTVGFALASKISHTTSLNILDINRFSSMRKAEVSAHHAVASFKQSNI
jgi:hypothetical protein